MDMMYRYTESVHWTEADGKIVGWRTPEGCSLTVKAVSRRNALEKALRRVKAFADAHHLNPEIEVRLVDEVETGGPQSILEKPAEEKKYDGGGWKNVPGHKTAGGWTT